MHLRILKVVVAIGMLAIAAFPVGFSQAAAPITIAVGDETADMAVQDVRLMPNVVRIRVGDTVTWEVRQRLPAVIVFLSGEPRPTLSPRRPGGQMYPEWAAPKGGAEYDGTGIRSSGLLGYGDRWSLTFTQPGAFDYADLFPANPISAQIIVAAGGGPADSSDSIEAQIDEQVAHDLSTRALPLVLQNAGGADLVTTDAGDVAVQVRAGAGDENADGSVLVLRFFPDNVTVRAGQQVTWKIQFPGHSVIVMPPDEVRQLPEWTTVQQSDGTSLLIRRFNLIPPQGGDTFDGSAMAYAGILNPPSSYTLRFTQPGIYEYQCLLHGDQGMAGTLTVRP